MYFVTAYMGGVHGTAKSARDFVRAMLACTDPVYVVSPKSEAFPETVCGRRLSQPIWHLVYGMRQPGQGWRLGPLSLLGYLRGRALIKDIKRHAGEQTVIVNGWASYAYWQSFQNCFAGHKAMIVRESPRHFDAADRDVELRHLLRGLATFDSLIFVSDTLKREWLEFDELKGKAAYYLPNCCEEEEVEEVRKHDRNAIRASFGFGEDDFVVVCPGTIEYRKGQDLLLDIVPELAGSLENIRVVFVGDPGTEWGRELVADVRQGKSAKWCTHMSSRPDILDLLYASDVLAFPSRAEAMPRTLLEAMALGTPVVAAGVDGVPELIVDGVTGILFPTETKQGLLNGLLAMARDPAAAREMAAKARERYWNEFSRKHQFDRVAEILDDLELRERSSRAAP